MVNNKSMLFIFITLFVSSFMFGVISVNAKGVACVYSGTGESKINVKYTENVGWNTNSDTVELSRSYFSIDDIKSDSDGSYFCPSILYYRLVTVSSRKVKWELSFANSRISEDRSKQNIEYTLNVPLLSSSTNPDVENPGDTPGDTPNGPAGAINVEPITCEDFIYGGNSLIDELFTLIMIVGPILVIILSAVDFAKASLASDESALKKAGNKFGKRLIAAALLVVLPLIINFILGIATEADIFDEIPDTCVDQNS